MPLYFKTPNYSIAFIPKVGCSSLSFAVIKSFQSYESDLIDNAHLPDGSTAEQMMWQCLVEREKWPSKQILAFVRDPIERFKSAMAQVNLSDVDGAINSILNDEKIECGKNVKRLISLKNNGHFKPQIMWVDETTKLYRFPDHISELFQEAGMTQQMPLINQSSFPKPQLTSEQIIKLQDIYAEDITLYNSITSPGIITGMISANRPQKPEVVIEEV